MKVKSDADTTGEMCIRDSYQRGLLFIRSRGSIRLGYEVNYICYAFSLNLLSPLLRMTGELLLILWVTAALLVYAPLRCV